MGRRNPDDAELLRSLKIETVGPPKSGGSLLWVTTATVRRTGDFAGEVAWYEKTPDSAFFNGVKLEGPEHALMAEDVFVLPEYRRRGVAKAMYEHARKVSGLPIIPNVIQTSKGQRLWKGLRKKGARINPDDEALVRDLRLDLRDEREFGDEYLEAIVRHPSHDHIAVMYFTIRGGMIVPKDVVVDRRFRRKGVASWMYRQVSRKFGMPISNDTIKTSDGRAFRSAARLNPSFVAYHGSRRAFPIEEHRHGGEGIVSTTFGPLKVERHGAFFSSKRAFAESFGSNVVKVRLAFKNLARIDRDLRDRFVGSLDPFGPDRDLWLLVRESGFKTWSLFDDEVGKRFVAWLKAQGYDGAVFDETTKRDDGVEVEGKTYVTFHPSQIRRAE